MSEHASVRSELAPKLIGGAALVNLPEQLSVAQHAAIAAITGGNSITDAAAAAGVSRVTVYSWIRHDPVFRAAYNAWRQELQESARSRLLKTLDQAVTVIAKAVDNGDTRTAVTVLTKFGVMAPVRPGPADPTLAADEIRIKQAEEVNALHRRSLGLRPDDLSPHDRYLREHREREEEERRRKAEAEKDNG